MEMQVEELDGGITNVVLRGRLDTVGAGAIDLRFNAIAGASRALIVDLSQVDFLSSLGIRVLVMGAKAVKSKGGKLALFSPGENVSSVLKTTGIDQLIPVISDWSAAMIAVGR
jgi:anti-anti-sigma factor